MDCTEAIVEFCPGNVFTILLSEKYVGIPTALTRVQQYSLPRRVPIDFIANRITDGVKMEMSSPPKLSLLRQGANLLRHWA